MKLLIISILFVIISSTGYGAETVFEEIKKPEVTVLYEAGLSSAAVQLSEKFPDIRKTVEAHLQMNLRGVPTIIIIRSHQKFLKRSENDLVIAYAVPAENVIVIDYSKTDVTPFDLNATLMHEVCHLILHQNIKSIPKWLDEGLAQHVSGGVSDIINPGEKDVLKQAVLSHGLLSVGNLADSFPVEKRRFLLAYEESRDFIDFLYEKRGDDGPMKFLSYLSAGFGLNEAFMKTFNATPALVEEDWRKNLERRYSWQTYAADHIIWLLFFAASLAVLLGFLRMKKRMRDYKDEGIDDEDRH